MSVFNDVSTRSKLLSVRTKNEYSVALELKEADSHLRFVPDIQLQVNWVTYHYN